MTRAEPGGSRTAARLTALGFEPVARPLLRIEPLTPALPVEPHDALIFTSPNGVAAWAALSPQRAAPVLTVGAATAEAARAAGFAFVRSADGDIEALAALIRADPALKATRLLHPAAETLAGDLSALIDGHARVETLPVYRAVETGAAAPQTFDAVLIHSPRAARVLAVVLSPDGARRRIACAISAKAAVPLAALPFAEVRVAAHPDESSLLVCLGKPPAAV